MGDYSDFADRLMAEKCPRVSYKMAQNLRFAGVDTEEDWLKGEWRWESRGIGPTTEAAINKHIGKTAGFPWEIRRPSEHWTYVTSPITGTVKQHVPAYHFTDYRMVYKRWHDYSSIRVREQYFIASLCGQTPLRAEYSMTPPADRPFCKLCSTLIDKEIAKH